jgi:hypothetical protein
MGSFFAEGKTPVAPQKTQKSVQKLYSGDPAGGSDPAASVNVRSRSRICAAELFRPYRRDKFGKP